MFTRNKYLISFILFLLIPLSASISTVTPDHPIKDGDRLVSKNEAFELGFFSPGKSIKRYVGIWYSKIPEQTIVWVANRDAPINDTTGILSVDASRNLVIHKFGNEIPVWSTNISVSDDRNSTYFAELLDTGNLVLFHGNDNQKVQSWQSFDYPANTRLPYMKLGVDRRTGFYRFLTSWRSADDPGIGEYSFKMNLTGSPPQQILYRGLVPKWRAGPWNGVRLSGVPEMTTQYIFNTTYVENSNEVYVMDNLRDPSIFTRMVLTELGTLQRLTWQNESKQWVEFFSTPKELCDYYGHCGPYGNCDASNLGEFECQCLPGFKPKSARNWYLRDGSGGCMPERGGRMCHSGEGFVKVVVGKVPDTSVAVVNRSVGVKECEEVCLRNCSCRGYASANISKGGTGCLTWHGDLIDTREFSSGGQDFHLRVDAVELAEYVKSQQSNGKKSIVAYILTPVVGLLVLLSLLFWLMKRKRRGRENRAPSTPKFSQYLGATSSVEDRGPHVELPFIDLNTIAAATDNFSVSNKLGQGGFGTVYKGRLPNGQEIAVKRLAKNSGQGAEEFKNEVTLIAKLQHKNLVKLLGFCTQQEEKMLIYEYLPNKGLDSFIFEKNKGLLLDWRKRHDIIVGVARGLLYLHQDSRLRIIHRDLKASNVLLDGSMNPKISDFGMARIFGADQDEANTNKVVGTYGYMAPEYAMEGLFSMKSDVFSLGVLLLEIISGTRNNNYYQNNSMNLIGHVWSLWNEDKALEVVDPLLDSSSYPIGEVLRCLHISLLCVQEHAGDRPTMSDIVFMLRHDTALPPPKQPAFILKARIGRYSSSASVGASSVNDQMITEVEAR